MEGGVGMKARRGLIGTMVILAGLIGLAALWSGCGGDQPVDPQAQKLLVIGIDSADWRLLDPMIEDGRMPNLAGFLDQAATGRMKTFVPLEKSPLLWASICTGVEPEVHGILQFVKGQEEELVSSSSWRAPALWDILDAAGRTTDVMGMWTTYPARDIAGVMVSDYLPYADKGPLPKLVTPDSLTDAITALRVTPEAVTRQDLARFIPADLLDEAEAAYPRQVQELRDVFASDLTYLAVADYLAHHGAEPDLFFFYLRGPDRISHHFYQYMAVDKDFVHADPAEVAAFKDVVRNYYAWVDEAVGEVLGWFPPDRPTVVLSDHGFYGPRQSGNKGVKEHSEWGIFAVRSPLYRAGVRFGHLELLDICPTMLALLGLPPAKDMPGMILSEPATSDGAKRLSRLDEHRVESYQGLAPASGPAGERNPEIDEQIRKQLRSLGYIN
ncbi:hypothetical protein CO151_01710 [bacterium CG_4_9_14_3_um_filter_65_15]|nr:MAG: hypothetical protein CO151_01710 [bacterium CG_4_9_14_3_um_filter_65_15]